MGNRGFSVISRGQSLGLVSIALAVVAAIAARPAPATKPGDRTISFYQTHTKDTVTVTYKSGGKYIPSAMKKLNWILRDWRTDQVITMDPKTIDLAWEMHNELGSNEPIHIISGYRSPKTNAMLRKTRGGQAKKSQHMLGKAIDITFPDVPIKRLRYSAMIRERGGVGYYPTSGVPFVHIDTARVRAWPRLPRYELALLFPSGKTKHRAAEGGAISKSDVAKARSKKKELAVQIAQFHADRKNPKARLTRVATLGVPKLASAPERVERPATSPATTRPTNDKVIERKPFAVASLTPGPAVSNLPWLNGGGSKPQAVTSQPNSKQRAQRAEKVVPPIKAQRPAQRPVGGTLTLASTGASKPQLVRAPRLIERSSQFKLRPSKTDQDALRKLIQTASLNPFTPSGASNDLRGRDTSDDAEVQTPEAATPQSGLAAAATRDTADGQRTTINGDTTATGPLGAMANIGARLAALSPDFSAIGITDMSPGELGNGWVQAPEFDDDHPDELAYRPFPLAPLLTATESVHAPELMQMIHPDVAATLDMIDDAGEAMPMAFRPGQQIASLHEAQRFLGKAVNLDSMTPTSETATASAIARRRVSLTASAGLNR